MRIVPRRRLSLDWRSSDTSQTNEIARNPISPAHSETRLCSPAPDPPDCLPNPSSPVNSKPSPVRRLGPLPTLRLGLPRNSVSRQTQSPVHLPASARRAPSTTPATSKIGPSTSEAYRQVSSAARAGARCASRSGGPTTIPPAACTAQYLDFASQRDFRKHESNDWSYGVSCFFCHLPQDICKRRNSERTCIYSQYRDAVRGILMMLTAYLDMLRDASELATVINPDYTIGEPDAPLRMGDEWRELTYYHNMPGYKAFQLVAAVLLLFANWRL